MSAFAEEFLHDVVEIANKSRKQGRKIAEDFGIFPRLCRTG